MCGNNNWFGGSWCWIIIIILIILFCCGNGFNGNGCGNDFC